MTPDAENFIKYNFQTTQDLCKQFITVVTAVLVFSITFSEKIIVYSSAGKPTRILLGLSWASMLLAIIACGIGLTMICIAGGQAVYGGDTLYLRTANVSYIWIVCAGVLFVSAMCLLITLAVNQGFRT